MKNILKIAFITLLSAVLFSGCGSDTPESATKKFLNSLKDGNVKDFKKYSTEGTQSLIRFSLIGHCPNINGDKELSVCLKLLADDVAEYIVTDIKEYDETSARVYVNAKLKSGLINKAKYDLKKIDGDWKVDTKGK